MTAQQTLKEAQYATDVMAMFNFFRAACFYGDYAATAPDTHLHGDFKKVIGDLSKRAKLDMQKIFWLYRKPTTKEQKAQVDSDWRTLSGELESIDFQGIAEIFRLLMVMDAQQRDTMEQIAVAMFEGRIKAEPDGFTVSDEMVAEKQSPN